MAAKNNRPDDVPHDLSFLSATGDPPEVSNEAIADKQPSAVPDVIDFQSLNVADDVPETAAPVEPLTIAEPASGLLQKPASESVAPKNLPTRSPENSAPQKATFSGLTPGLTEKLPAAVVGYAVAVTLLLLFFLFTGRLSLSASRALESLPDIRPLPPSEFRRVLDGTALSDDHVMNLGESRRFGDVVLTPLRVTREPLNFQGFLSGESEDSLTTAPVLKLWLKFENVADDYGFPPFDAGLMSYRSPPNAIDESTAVNSFLTVAVPSNDKPTTRILNYLQTMDSNFILTGQESARVVMPGETLNTFMACSEDIASVNATGDTAYTWRIQFRKGVHQSSGNGVTTLVDVKFSGSDISEDAPASTLAQVQHANVSLNLVWGKGDFRRRLFLCSLTER